MTSTSPPQTVEELMDRYDRGERDFSGVHLEDAKFAWDELEGANFSGAVLGHARFFQVILKNCCFDRAKLTSLEANYLTLTQCSFHKALLDFSHIRVGDWIDSDFTDADLAHTFCFRVDFQNSDFMRARLYDTGLMNCDIRAFCRANATLFHTGPSYVDHTTILRSLRAPNLKDFLLRTGMSPIFVDYAIDCARAINNPVLSRMMQSTFISYGGPDAAFARKLYEALHENGVTTFFFPEHATPGKRLHRVMREGVNQHDRVVLICSEASLTRPGVLNEIEETLAREAREGGESYLIPITLDDYVFSGWAPIRPDLAQAIRDRVVADFSGADTDESRFTAALLRLLSALKR